MRRFLAPGILATLAALAGVSAAAAQQNPFKLPKQNVKAMQVQYAYAGDMTGTGQVAIDGDRRASRETTTGKFFGKTVTTDSWTLSTPDSTYNADLTKHQGTRAPNVMPYMAKAYDALDGAGKVRLHQNMQDMAQMIGRAFGSQALWSGEKTGTKTYAGEECDETTFGSFSYCGMKSAPAVPLHVSGSLMCVNFEQTATSVTKSAPAGDAFAPPAGVTFQDNAAFSNPDSLARGFVNYLASQQLADSIAKAKAEMASKASAATTPGQPTAGHTMTPEEKEQAKKSCEALKNFDLGKAMSDAAKQTVNEAVHEAVEEKKAETKQDAKNKIKGLIKKPRF
jgi:hypothetical protein